MVNIQLTPEEASNLYTILDIYGDGGIMNERDSDLINKIQSLIFEQLK